MSDPRGFLKFEREEALKREPSERVRDWKETTIPLTELRIKEQATRCMDCGVPFCHTPPGCPLENLIPEWNRLASDGHWSDALRILHSTNNFPEFTGKVCPAPCESVCVLSIGSSPVTISAIESRIVEHGFRLGRVLPQPPLEHSGRRVAIVGAGPAGLAAAQQLARLGHEVKVFEKSQKPGGILRYGIPDFKMEKSLIDRRIEQLRAEGVEFVTGTEVGVDLSLQQLEREFDAIGLAIGAESPRNIEIPGRDLQGIEFAMSYLSQQNKRNAGEAIDGPEILARGKRVLVIGGGDTGSDCLGTALRQGCQAAIQIEILPRPPHPKTTHAHEEGGARDWSILTKRFLPKPGTSEVGSVLCARLEWEGRSFREIAGSEFEIPADLVLIAAGFTGVRASESLGLALSKQGVLATDSRHRTSNPKIFAAGDARRGASLVVWAIAEGRKMAEAIHEDFSKGSSS